MDSYTKLRRQLNKYIKNYPLPSRAENLNRFKQLRLMREQLPLNTDKYNALRDTIIISNGGFAMKYAIAYCKKINDSSIIDDLFQQAQIGIVEAVDRFDPDRKVNFTTFAFFYVRKCIIDYIKKSNKVISVNRNIAKYIKHIVEIKDVLLMENEGFEPSVLDIKIALLERKDINVTTLIIIQLLNLIELNSSSSDTSFTTNNFDDIKSFDSYESILLFKSVISSQVKYLEDDIIDLINMRFGIGYDRPYNLDEIQFIKQLSDDDIAKLIQITNNID